MDKATGAPEDMSIADRLHTIIRAIWQSVFFPSRFARDKAAYTFAARYGWTLILARWGYYTIAFQFRNYHGRWEPFRPPPFGLSIDTYASLQRLLSLPFGLLLMSVLAAATVAYLHCLHKAASFTSVFNILGLTYFLPFVLLQPLDHLIIGLAGWRMLPIAVLHTVALAWESWASVKILNQIYGLSRTHRLLIGILLAALWIAIAGSVWR